MCPPYFSAQARVQKQDSMASIKNGFRLEAGLAAIQDMTHCHDRQVGKKTYLYFISFLNLQSGDKLRWVIPKDHRIITSARCSKNNYSMGPALTRYCRGFPLLTR